MKSILQFFAKKPEFHEKSYRISFDKPDEWKKYLKDHGFVVIANYLPQFECQEYLGQIWDVMHKISLKKLNRNSIDSQINAENYPSNGRGMINYVGHSQAQWNLRKRCRPIFQTLWQTKQVKSSFDGFCFMNGLIQKPEQPLTDFIHADQSPSYNGLWSYQGICTLTTNGKGEGGFVVIPDTHLMHYKFTNRKGENHQWYSDFVMFNKDDKTDPIFKKVIKVNTQAGDFILFDSRTFHSNTYPKKPVLRVCTYICMLPKSMIPEGMGYDELRKKAFHEKRTSTHHPGSGFNLFPLPYNLPESQKQAITEANTFVSDKEIEDLI